MVIELPLGQAVAMSMHLHWSDGLILCGLAAGFLVAGQKWRTPDGDPYATLPLPSVGSNTQLVAIVLYACATIAIADSLRGFLYLFLEPTGAALIGSIAGNIAFERGSRARQRRRIAKWESGGPGR